jgi:Zn-dependent protease
MFIAYYGFDEQLDTKQVLWICLGAVGLFTSILLHEFGHALTARRYGVQTKDIILLPIGGLARLTRLPERPFHEFLVAIAGPMVNLVLALLMLPYFIFVRAKLLDGYPVPTPDTLIGDFFYFLPMMFALNIGLAIFNLLPAFPMDGGRILRALLSIPWGRYKATQVAVVLGQLLATAMAIYGVWNDHYSYLLIGLFIFFTASQELKWVKMEHLLKSVKAGSVARTAFTKLYLSDPIQVPYDLLLRNQERHFLVFDENEGYAGTLSEGDMLEKMKENGPGALVVGDVYQKGNHRLDWGSDLKEASDKMRESGADILPVYQEGQAAGVVDIELIQHVLALKKQFKLQGPKQADSTVI